MPPTRTFGLFRLEDRAVPTAAFQNYPVVPQIDGEMQAHLQQVLTQGQAAGNRENVFAKAGDSITFTDPPLYSSPSFVPLGSPGFDSVTSGLSGKGDALVDTWRTFLAPVDGLGENSFTRNSASAFPGWISTNIVQTAAREVDAIHPAVALVMIGTNDSIHRNSDLYRGNLRQIVNIYLDRGVIPVLSTIPPKDYSGGVDQAWVMTANQIIVEVAEEADVPVWNLWKGLQGLPADGLADGVHLNADPGGGANFSPYGLAFGADVRNLSALQVLTKLRQVVFGGGLPDGYAVPQTLPWQPLTPGERVIAIGAGPGNAPTVRLLDADTGKLLTQFEAYSPTFLGGVRVAVGDLNGDGIPDVVTAPGAGGGPEVNAYSGADGSQLFSFFAYEPGFRGGVTVAVGDAAGTGRADVVVGAGPGGGPRVRVFRGGDFALVADFFAFEPTFRGGVNVAVGNFGPGFGPAVAVGPGAGGGGLVKLFDFGGTLLQTLGVFDPDYRGGVNVAAGDLAGNGVADVVAGAVVGSTRVRVLSPAGDEVSSFFAGGADRKGARVGVVPAAGTAAGIVLTGTADSSGAVSLFDPKGGRIKRAPGSTESFILNGPYVAG